MHKIAALAVVAALCGMAAARAEVRVSGTADNVEVRIKSATLTEVVAGLEAASHARIEVKGATSRQFTGIYSGSLQKVLARLLIGIDHIVHTAPDRITIVLMTADAGPPAAVAATRDDGGGSSVQGWTPTARQVAAAAPMPQPHAAQPAAEDAEPSGVQGWVPTAIQVASIAAPPQTRTAGGATANETAAEEPSGVQGWMPAQVATAAQPAPVAVPGNDTIAADNGAEGGVQGWIPTPAKAN